MGDLYSSNDTSGSPVTGYVTWGVGAKNYTYKSMYAAANTGDYLSWALPPTSHWQPYQHVKIVATADQSGHFDATVTDSHGFQWTATFHHTDTTKYLKNGLQETDTAGVDWDDILNSPPPKPVGKFNTQLFDKVPHTPKYETTPHPPQHTPTPPPAVKKSTYLKGLYYGESEPFTHNQTIAAPQPQPAPIPPYPVSDTYLNALHDYREHVQVTHGWDPLVPVNEQGWIAHPAGMIETPTDWGLPEYSKSLLTRIRRIARGFGPGTIVGRGRGKMTKHQREAWLIAWLNGDLRTCWTVECTVTVPDTLHPGNPHYNLDPVIWAPAIDGEAPAGQSITGAWPAPPFNWDDESISTYLVYAHKRDATHLHPQERRNWVDAHINGNVCRANQISIEANNRFLAVNGTPTTYPKPWTVEHTDRTDEPKTWSLPVLRAYAQHHNLPYLHTYPRLLDQITTHRAAATAAAEAARNILHFHTDPDQPTLSGYHRKIMLLDQHGHRWLFKPAPEGRRFRADTEHHANTLARAWGYRTAESRLIEHDGVYGQAQRWHDNATSLTGVDLTTLTVHQLTDIALEHLLDWAIDNDDGHPENIQKLPAGNIVGIDKGRAWRYFGGWDGLSGNHTSDTNCNLLYTQLYNTITGGSIPQDTTDQIYTAVINRARRIQHHPDSDVETHIRDAVKDRPHYRPSSYQSTVPHAPTTADELATAALTRKHHLTDDMQALWTRIYTNTGWTLPTTVPLLNPQGHPIHTDLHSPDLHTAIRTTKLYGTPAFVHGTDIEDAHILFWRELNPDKQIVIRGHLKVRAAAHSRIAAWCASALAATTSNPHFTADPLVKVLERVPAGRNAAGLGDVPVLADDGELHLCHRSFPLWGSQYRLKLHNGDSLRFRSGEHDTDTPLTMQGTITLSLVDDGTDLSPRITALTDLLHRMGVTISPVNEQDLELFYWRHIAGIIHQRADKVSGNYPEMTEYHSRIAGRFDATIGKLKNLDPDAELTAWRHAFAAFTNPEQIAAFTAAGEHLPHFMHQDLRRPTQPNGAPYWNRFDTTLQHARTKPMPGIAYRSGPINVVRTGVCYATEDRLRHLAVPKLGMSSHEDAKAGSAGFIFMRQNYEANFHTALTVYLNPHILLRTSNYAYSGDHYGRLCDRPESTYWRFDTTTNLRSSSNELLVKHAVSLLDDIEILGFPSPEQRDHAVTQLVALGITELRGVPITTRFIWMHDTHARLEAFRHIRATY